MWYKYVYHLCYIVQEFFTFGIMNGIGTFFSCYISSLALSRSIVQDVTGGKTQVSNYKVVTFNYLCTYVLKS